MPKILVADDNEEMLETLERIFLFYHFEVEKARDGKEAVELAEKTLPDIILMDGMMPVMDGFEACRIIKSKLETKDIPIVFLTANYVKTNDRIVGFELGADDYLLKPFNSKELVARTRSILKRGEMLRLLKSENEQLSEKNKIIQDELKSLLEQSKEIEHDSVIDPLTGLYSFTFFKKRLKEEYQRAVRYETDISLVIVSFDNLDKTNEVFGQQLINYLMMKMANLLLNKTRTSDIVARSTDDLYYIILPQTDEQGAFLEAERIRVTLTDIDFLNDDMLEALNVSRRKIGELRQIKANVGVATCASDEIKTKSDEDLFTNTMHALRSSESSSANLTIAYGKIIR
jgi:diguanylate cyclase (GGDEF)-like protein